MKNLEQDLWQLIGFKKGRNMLLRYKILSGVMIAIGLLLVWGFACLIVNLVEKMAIEFIIEQGYKMKLYKPTIDKIKMPLNHLYDYGLGAGKNMNMGNKEYEIERATLYIIDIFKKRRDRR